MSEQVSFYSHAKHLLAVDCVIFGYEQGELKLLLYRRTFDPQKGNWSLIGGFLNEDESLEDAAGRVLKQITGLTNIFLQQVFTFSQPDREPNVRVLSAAFVALIRIDQQNQESLEKLGAQWLSVTKLPELIFDHHEMVGRALAFLQNRAAHELAGRELLPERFTFIQLRNLYEAIFQRAFDPGNFRKKVLSLNAIERTNVKNKTESKRGAYYYRFKKKSDPNGGDRIFKAGAAGF